MPQNKSIKKVLVIGSGPIVIGQAAEFDYAGTQACRVLKQAGVNVVLVNSNPATIMTDKSMADEIYLEPLTIETLKRIIRKERPDSLLAGLGGQTGLTLAMQLSKSGFLDEMNVQLLGTNAEAIDKAEDRRLFKDTMSSIGQPCIPSDIATSVEESLAIAKRIGYPVVVRPAFTLGGTGGGVAYSAEELKLVAHTGLDASPITQVLIERYIFGWKEVEFETMRDSAGNAIIICSMENLDPVGIHTGDSIVMAPALTLAAPEYNMLATAALNIIDALGIVGGCNCQFALDPESMDYAVIEVNPRVSRSSALASKATGYPIAKVTTWLALGCTLDEVPNEVTGKTYACSEPTVDYVVLKFPKWPFDKFLNSSRKLGTQMKATGEVMSIAPNFEMALLKAVRGAEISLDTLNSPAKTKASLKERLLQMDDMRIFTVFEALKQGVDIEDLYSVTKIDRWFLYKLQGLAEFEQSLEQNGIDDDSYLQGKQLGYTDAALKRLSGAESVPHRAASYKMVDTCSAEHAARTPYFYSSYDADCEARRFPARKKPTIIVLGSGPIRIGQGIEFDYASVHCVWALQKMGYEVVIINNNPETVSTDYDTADRLYFEPLTPEDVMNVIEVEQPVGVVVAFGGQTAIKLTKYLDQQGITILGTSADSIDLAEDRERFDELLSQFNIRHPQGFGVMTMEEALKAANTLGYPVLLRPSYVIGGQNMTIARSDDDVRQYMTIILGSEIENPVLVDKYMMGQELEVDVISDGKDVLIPGIMEHVERAGVHSGDSIAVYPSFNLNDRMLHTVIDCSEKLALAIGTKGLVNIQYLIYENELYVIEVNPRASRTIPYISKVTGVPMVELAAKVMIGQKLSELGYGTGLYKIPPYYAVKVPVFSFEKLSDANSILGPEMKSTGEVLGIGKTMMEALFKGLTAAGFKITLPDANKETGVLISVDNHDDNGLLKLSKKLHDLGMTIYATPDTAATISLLGIDVITVQGMDAGGDVMQLLEEGKVSYVVYTGALYDATMGDYIVLHRRALQLSVVCLTALDTANALADIIASRFNQYNTELIDLNSMRTERMRLSFSKMQGTGSDYICFNNMDGCIPGPESLCVSLCDRHFGIGGDGIVLIEKSELADAKMRVFIKDGSREQTGGNTIRCVAKYLYDNGMVKKDEMLIETSSGLHQVKAYITNGLVSWVDVNMGPADLSLAAIPCTLEGETALERELVVDGEPYTCSLVSLGNPHCVVFCDRVDSMDVEALGAKFERSNIFPDQISTEFIRVVNKTTIKIRSYESGNGETMSSGTGACAAVVAAVNAGLCKKDRDITVKCKGGDLVVKYTDEAVLLSGEARLVYSGEVEI